ncbi:tagatose 1,6-diphosphate aldolase [Psittacicella hinzii]|uniref:tagatose-bisphosphate aldolase n=1 Tax=Psittacicella hinzii TaxID=2028575 RepID=A0A3A1YQ71_9GAMM|nr:tagatose 1,6-diphosphate aldolase [Psittacicella hinzii]RIY40443.1 tagatose-bisphosphate aldolase [Psittacicella hinzii]
MSHVEKKAQLVKLMTASGIINALAIDQRGALRRLIGDTTPVADLEHFKCLVSKELTPYSSSILLDPEIGIPGSKERDANCGLLMAYEKTGYDKTVKGRYPDLLDLFSVKRLKDLGSNGIKLLIYYDVDEGDEVNERKRAFVERVGAECCHANLPLFLEILTYDHTTDDKVEFAKVKPRKVIAAMQEFSNPVYEVDVLKVEVPVDMNLVEGFTKEGVTPVYTQAQAAEFFAQQSAATHLPFIFLSAGVSPELFRQTLAFAKEGGSTFNGVLCGRATWAGAAEEYAKSGSQGVVAWLRETGVQNITALNEVVEKYATPVDLDKLYSK